MSKSKGYGLSGVFKKKRMDAPHLPYLPPSPRTYRPRIALVGCGGVSEYHLRNYQKLDLDVIALCSRTQESAETRRHEFYPQAAVYTDYRRMLDNEQIDVVDIALHPLDRLPVIEDALQRGKHVLSQKPFVTDLDQGERLVALAENSGVSIAVNHNGRWAPHFSYLRQAIRAGLIGKVASVDFALQWDHTWIESTPFNNLHHLVLYDFAIHWFDLLGQCIPNQKALSVQATVSKLAYQTAKPPMAAHALVDYGNAQATLSFNANAIYGQKDETTICGERGTLRSEGPSLSEQSVMLFTEEGVAQPDLEGTWFENGFQGAMGELLCAIEEKREPENSARSSIAGLELCFAAIASADHGGKPVKPGSVRALPTT